MKDEGGDVNPLFADVMPGGVLGRMLRAIGNPRRHRWKAYLRACKRIPKDSPVAGSTSFMVLNARRHELIKSRMEARGKLGKRWAELDEDPEFKALQDATSEWLCGPLVAENFLLARKLRQLRRQHPEIQDDEN